MSKAKKLFTGNYYELIGILFLVIGVCSNATVGIFIRITDVSAVVAAFYRFVLSLPVFVIYFLCFDRAALKVPKQYFSLYVIAGMCFVGGIIAANYSFRYTTIANAELFGNLLPFVVIPLSWLFFRERIPWNFFLALVIAFFGIFLMMVGKIEPSWESFVGDLLAFLVSVLYGFYVIVIATVRRSHSGSQTLFYCSTMATLMLLPYVLLFESQIIPGNRQSFFALLGLSWISHLLGAGLIVRGIGRVNQSLAAVIIMAQPVVGAIYGFVFMNELLSLLEITGIFVCIIGVIYAKFAAAKIRKPLVVNPPTTALSTKEIRKEV